MTSPESDLDFQRDLQLSGFGADLIMLLVSASHDLPPPLPLSRPVSLVRAAESMGGMLLMLSCKIVLCVWNIFPRIYLDVLFGPH